MASGTGGFIWYELLTRDPEAAELFYRDVVGWNFVGFEGPPGGSPYRIARAGEAGVGGVMAIPAAAPDMRPGWFGYLHVADADAAIEEVLAVGGSVVMPATTIANVGRIAMLADPQGVTFYVMQPGMDGESGSFSPGRVGHVGWNELSSDDVAAALAFYTHQFGWSRGEPVPMGETGQYAILMRGGVPIAGAMPRMNERLPAAWAFYFRVADIEAAADRIRAGGGKVLHGPAEVPGGSRIVIALDPQAALFGLLA